MYYTNKKVEELFRVFDQNERAGYLRLDLNENPGGLDPEFVKEVLSDVTPEMIAQYPETNEFSNVLSEYLGTDKDHICLVNGSAEGIRYIIQAFSSEEGEIVGVVPSYFMFQVYAEMYGRKFTGVPYDDDLSMDISRILKALKETTQLLILMNPNNPMGNAYSDEEIETILAVCREKQITVLIDEAYYYFHPKSFIQYALNERRILITRTFSKLFSMAGCRLGYVIGHPEDIHVIQNLCTPHNTNVFALLFAERMIRTPGRIDELIKIFNRGRAYLLNALESNGYRYKGETGNFIFIEPKTDADKVVSILRKEKKILIKKYPHVGEMGDCLRVTIGAPEYMEVFMNALIEVDR